MQKKAIIGGIAAVWLFSISIVSYCDGIQIKSFEKDKQTYYIVCSVPEDIKLHDPVPWFIEPTSEGNTCDDWEIMAYYDQELDLVKSAIYVKSTNYFSGFVFSEIRGFFDGGLAAATPLDCRKWGYINKRGEVVIPYQWEWAEDFKNGIALVTYETATGYENVWINEKGEIISVDPTWGDSIQECDKDS